MNKKYIFFVISIIIIGLVSCQSSSGHSHDGHDDHDHDHDHSDEQTTKEDDHDHGDEIFFSDIQAQKVGLETVMVKAGKFHQVIKTSGQILSAQGDERTLSATMSGIVSFNKASLDEGMPVRAGETLLSISGKNILDGDPVQKAINNYQSSKKEFERAEKLIVDKLISELEFNEKKLNYDNAKLEYNALASRQTSKGSGISSPIGGFIKTCLVEEGEFVEVGQTLATVTQTKRLRLTADVAERYYKYLNGIRSANFKTPYDDTVYELSDLSGKLLSYGRSVSNDQYTLPVNFEFNNVGNIIPGSFVDVFLLSDERDNVITLPISALVEDQGAYFVFTEVHPEDYEKQEVKIGASDGSRVEILSGVAEGDVVVVKAAIHIQLASSAEAMPHAHEH